MSLKAKLEAVIYASEDPVTLPQLASLFADEALEWKAEVEAAEAAAAAEAAVANPLPLLNQPFEGSETEGGKVEPAEAATGESIPAPAEMGATETAAEDPDAGDEPPSEAQAEPQTPAAETAAEGASASAEDAPAQAAEPSEEEAARQAARQRDREVRAALRRILDELIEDYAADGRGVEIREIAGGYRMATKPEHHDAVRAFVKSLKPALKLSLPALETLAVIAYKQPVTAPEVNEIRGVDSSGVFGSLLARKLIATAGRKQVVGRPILYKTTREFLLRFGLKDISELPSMEEFEKIAASELDEPEIPLTDSEQPPATEESAAEIIDAEGNATPEQEAGAEAAPEAEPASTSQEAAAGTSQASRE